MSPIPAIDGQLLRLDVLAEVDGHEFFQTLDVLTSIGFARCERGSETTYGVLESIVTQRAVALGDELQPVASRTLHPLDAVDFILGQRFHFARA